MTNHRWPLVGLSAICIALSALMSGALAQPSNGQSEGIPALEPFLVKDCTGPAAGKTLCYYCRYELRPVVCVFVDRVDDRVGELVSAIDTAVARHKARRLAAFVVYLGDDTETAERALRELAARRKVAGTPLTIYRDTPEKLTAGLGVSPKSPLTIRYWRGGKIVGEQVHGSTQLGDDGISRIVAALDQLVQ